MASMERLGHVRGTEFDNLTPSAQHTQLGTSIAYYAFLAFTRVLWISEPMVAIAAWLFMSVYPLIPYSCFCSITYRIRLQDLESWGAQSQLA